MNIFAERDCRVSYCFIFCYCCLFILCEFRASVSIEWILVFAVFSLLWRVLAEYGEEHAEGIDESAAL